MQLLTPSLWRTAVRELALHACICLCTRNFADFSGKILIWSRFVVGVVVAAVSSVFVVVVVAVAVVVRNAWEKESALVPV